MIGVDYGVFAMLIGGSLIAACGLAWALVVLTCNALGIDLRDES